MKIRYENSMPLAGEYLNTLGVAEGFDTGSLNPEDLVDIDVLAVRSTTRVNAELLSCANRLALVATATAGYNHLDVQYLDMQGIHWTSSAGCNAQAVAEYVLSVLANAHLNNVLDLHTATVGVVGAGHVGSALSGLLEALSIDYKLYDPPLAESGDSREFTSWADIQACDVISLHVPLTTGEYYPTKAMINADVLAGLNSQQLLINACRGEVIDESALKQRLLQPDAPRVVLDVFNGEPNIDQTLLPLVWMATPHIAGHSVEGKVRGTQRVYEAACELKGQTVSLGMDDFIAPPATLTPSISQHDTSCSLSTVLQTLLDVYDVSQDDRDFRVGLADNVSFSYLRTHYRVRRELAAHRVALSVSAPDQTVKMLDALRMQVIHR